MWGGGGDTDLAVESALAPSLQGELAMATLCSLLVLVGLRPRLRSGGVSIGVRGYVQFMFDHGGEGGGYRSPAFPSGGGSEVCVAGWRRGRGEGGGGPYRSNTQQHRRCCT